MFKIFVKNLRLYGYHGVRDEERKKGQYFIFNLEMEIGDRDFLDDDRIENTFSYSDAIRIVTGINDSRRFDLLETFCQAVADAVLEYSPLVEKVKVTIEKPSSPIEGELDSVGVTLECERRENPGEKTCMDNKKSNREVKMRGSKVRVYLSLGSNKGDRGKNLRAALEMIKRDPRIEVIKVSSIYRTEPMYVKRQKYFYNMVIITLVDSMLGAFELLGLLKGIEHRLGRKSTALRFGPRPIDIDILEYGQMVLKSEILTLPHPRMKERNFVLVPLMEIEPGYRIEGIAIGEYLKKAGLPEKVRRL